MWIKKTGNGTGSVRGAFNEIYILEMTSVLAKGHARHARQDVLSSFEFSSLVIIFKRAGNM